MLNQADKQPFDPVALTNKIIKTIDETAAAILLRADKISHRDVDISASRLGFNNDNDRNKTAQKNKLARSKKLDDFYGKILPFQRKITDNSQETTEQLEEINKNTSLLQTIKDLFKTYLTKIFHTLTEHKDINSRIYKLQEADSRASRTRDLRAWWSKKNIVERQQIRAEKVAYKIADSSPLAESAMRNLGAAGNLLGILGGKAFTSVFAQIEKIIPGISRITGGATSLMAGGPGGKVGALGTLLKLATTFGRISLGFGIILLPVMSIFKHTELIGEYMDAFSNLWAAVAPAFNKLVDLTSKALAYFTGGEGDGILDTIGWVINKLLITLIGTVLPQLFKGIGWAVETAIDILSPLVQGTSELITMSINNIKELVYNVLGIFGVGPYKDKGFIAILTDIFNPAKILGDLATQANIIVNMTAETLLKIPQALWSLLKGMFDNLIGLFVTFENGETFSQNVTSLFNGFVESYFDFIGSMFDKVTGAFSYILTSVGDFISQWDIGKVVVNKVKSLFEVITSALPSGEDIKEYMKTMLAKIPGGQWLSDRIFNEKESPGNFQKMIDGMSNVQSSLQDQAELLADGLKVNADRIKGDIIEGGRTLYENLPTPNIELGDTQKKITEAASATMDKISEFVDEGKKAFKDIKDSDVLVNTKKAISDKTTKAGNIIYQQYTTYAPQSSTTNNATVNTSKTFQGRATTSPNLNGYERRLLSSPGR